MDQSRTIIMLSGWMQSGKDTVGEYLCKHFGFHRFAFADVLKDEISEMFDISRESLDTTKGKSTIYDKTTGKTVRDLLITHGQQRRAEYLDYWVERVIRTIEQKESSGTQFFNKIVITDWRFPNEYFSLKSWLAKESGSTIYSWRINRWKDPPLKDETELALDDFHFDLVLNNQGSIAELYEMTRKSTYNLKDPRVGILLVDVDEVLLKWIDGFSSWVTQKGYTLSQEYPISWNLETWIRRENGETMDIDSVRNLVSEFNHSAYFEHLKPCAYSETALREIKNAGFHIVTISSCTDNVDAIKKREVNLAQVFGNSIDVIICLALGSCKKNVLATFPPCIWIDDNPVNVRVGNSLGHKSYIMKRPWNATQLMEDAFDLDVLTDWNHAKKVILQ